MGKKQQVLEALFEHCQATSNFIFDNHLVKQFTTQYGFGNPFDVTKADSTAILPDSIKAENYFLLHLGEGRHQFTKGLTYGYHPFEPIPPEAVFAWKYRKSLLNEFDTSESNILSVANNQRIIHDFLYQDIVASPKVYMARRTNISGTYYVNDTAVSVNNLQIEIDLTLEYQGTVTIVEGKNGFPSDFAVYQIFLPSLYYHFLQQENALPINQISCCYLLRKRDADGSTLRVYEYRFANPLDMSSIQLDRCAEYRLTQR
jgi:hypothetical protein